MGKLPWLPNVLQVKRADAIYPESIHKPNTWYFGASSLSYTTASFRTITSIELPNSSKTKKVIF